MKKLISGVLAAAMLLGVGTLAACGDDDDLEVYCPDGAPALALAQAFAMEDADDVFDYHVVDASTIEGYVTGARPKADVCILPLNTASLLLGTGEKYQMLGTVTNGNLYFLTTGDNPAITKDNLSSLVGKKVGVVQLVNVPGLTLQAVLSDNQIAYQRIAGVEAEAAADKVNLVAFTPDNVSPAGKCDYYLCPEPAASTKVKKTATTEKPFKDAGSLQTLYGENGFPQAVAVAKKSVIEKRKEDLDKLLGYLGGSAAYLESTSPATLVALLDDERDGGTPSFTAETLTSEVVTRCSVKFTPSAQCKESVNAFLKKLIAVNADSAKETADAFYYLG